LFRDTPESATPMMELFKDMEAKTTDGLGAVELNV
jgi:hypothetical protein